MSDSDPTTLLREHVCRYWGPASSDNESSCECGWWGEDWAAHVAAVLSGVYAITPLPEPARIQEDADGTLDDFYVTNASIHFEAMSKTSWWIGITAADGRKWHINCGAHNDRAKTYAYVEEDDPRRALADALVDHLLGRAQETPQ